MSLPAPRYVVWYHDWRQWKHGKYTENKSSSWELPWIWDSHTQQRIVAPELYKTYSERSQWAHKRSAFMNKQQDDPDGTSLQSPSDTDPSSPS